MHKFLISQEKKQFGIVASFNNPSKVLKAAKDLRNAGFRKWDVFTPFPVHGMDAAMGIQRSIIPRFTLLSGLIGFTFGILMTWYMNKFDYSLIVGGKPFWSPIFSFPICYELTILFAAFGTFFGMFWTNHIPKYYHPIFNYKQFARASDDTFFIVIEAKDPLFNFEQNSTFFQKNGACNITFVEL